MKRNPQDINRAAGKDKLSALIIMFLMAALLFFLFMLMSGGKALADPRGRGMGIKMGQRLYTNGDLMPEQSARMEKIHKEHWKKIVPLRQELSAKKAELRILDSRSKTDADRIGGLRKNIQELQENIREKNLQYRFHCRELLNPTSRILSQELMNEIHFFKNRTL